jgi:hypothetical protein
MNQPVTVLQFSDFWLKFPRKKKRLTNSFLQIAVLGGSLLGTFLSEKVKQ